MQNAKPTENFSLIGAEIATKLSEKEISKLEDKISLQLDKTDGTVVSITEYRRLTGDKTSTDERIVERLQYLEAFCRNVIKNELKKYEIRK